MDTSNPITRMLHARLERLPQEPTLPPIYPTVGFQFDSTSHAQAVFEGRQPGVVGARGWNPTAALLEQKLALLEGSANALVVPSGMAAVTAGILAFAQAGHNIVFDHCTYVGTHQLLRDVLPSWGIEARTANLTDLREVERVLNSGTREIFAESPGSWQLKVPDLRALAQLAHTAGAKLVVDGTHATPYLQQPLAHGADLVVYSASGMLNGHGDIIMGVIAGDTATISRLRTVFRNEMGASVSPFDAWLVNRALATLAVRLDRLCATAQTVAAHLEGTSGIARVIYPGLPTHPQYHLALRQLKGGGGIIVIELDDAAQVQPFVDSLRLCVLSVGLGGPVTTAFVPFHSYPHLTAEEMHLHGVNSRMIRISVGLEDPSDILADLDQALRTALRS
jgi:cystathionine beta-lyase/cystathionine gamma-synthase